MEIVESKEIPIPLAKKLFEKRMEQEVTDIQRKTYDYLTRFTKIPPDKCEELLNKLQELGFKRITCVQLINICPESVDEARVLMNFEDRTVTTEELEQVVELIKSYLSSESSESKE